MPAVQEGANLWSRDPSVRRMACPDRPVSPISPFGSRDAGIRLRRTSTRRPLICSMDRADGLQVLSIVSRSWLIIFNPSSDRIREARSLFHGPARLFNQLRVLFSSVSDKLSRASNSSTVLLSRYLLSNTDDTKPGQYDYLCQCILNTRICDDCQQKYGPHSKS